MSSDDIRVAGRFTIPASELSWRFSTTGGPGGQHANKSATRAELSWDVATSPSITDDLRDRIIDRLGSRIAGGVLTVTADDTRSQWRNRAQARRRLVELLEDATTPPSKRKPTRPHRSARRRRLEEKRRRAETKRLRRKPENE